MEASASSFNNVGEGIGNEETESTTFSNPEVHGIIDTEQQDGVLSEAVTVLPDLEAPGRGTQNRSAMKNVDEAPE